MDWSPEHIEAMERRAEAAGLTREDLQKEAGAHRTTWARWKKGRGSPTVADWARVERLVAKHESAARPETPPASKAA